MSLFDKIFRRKKNNLTLSAEEAFAPELEPAKEEAKAPAAEPEKPAAEIARPTEPEKAKVVFTKSLKIYAASANPDDVFTLLRPLFVDKAASVSEDGDSCAVTLREGLSLNVTKAEAGFVDRLTRRYGVLSGVNIAPVLMQISLFNLCLVIKESADSRAGLDEIKPLILETSSLLKGFIEWDETALYTAEDTLLINTAGESEIDGFMPETIVPEAPDPDLARAESSFEQMKAHGINFDSGKPVQIPAGDVSLRPIDEIASRAAALFACVLTASAYMAPSQVSNPVSFSENAVKRLDKQYRVMSAFTPKEKTYLKKPQYHAAYFMKSEACAALLWALGYMELPWPDKPCEIEKLGAVLKNSDMQMLIAGSHPRSTDELLAAQDLTFRLHSYCVLSENSANISEDAVYERHYALNWLLGVNGITAWDDIIPKT